MCVILAYSRERTADRRKNMAFSNPESSIKDGIAELQSTLDALAQRYLDGSNSIYMLYLIEITPPEPSDLSDRSDDLE